MLVENPHDAEAFMKGTFVYQRKRRSDVWEDYNEVPLKTLRAEEWVRMELSSEELQSLLLHCGALFRLHQRSGLPRRKLHLLKVQLDDREDVEAATRLDLRQVIRLARSAGVDVLADLMKWLGASGSTAEVLGALRNMDADALMRLGNLASASAVRAAVDAWESNRENSSEEYWQQTLEKYAFVLAQAFSFPIILIESKAYVGGKALDNRGGNIADYLAANAFTGNAVIIEIKTPTTPLLGSPYRGVFSPSSELSGAITQALNYRLSLTREIFSLGSRDERMDVFAPHCLVVAGDAGQMLADEPRRRSFELLRNAYKDVQVITFDELFGKARTLVAALEGD
jgi:hypothetical protein